MSGARETERPALRWRFPDAGESALRAVLQRQIDEWWEAFAAKTANLDALFKGKQKWDLEAWMECHLRIISDELFWEFGPGITGGHRLVITSETNRHVRQLVNQILRSAPAISGWDFVAYRPSEPLKQVVATVEGRTGVQLSSLTTAVEPAHFGMLRIKLFSHDGDDAERGGAIAAEATLGEETLDRWIGVISHHSGRGVPLDNLKSLVDGFIEARRSQLSAAPWHLRIADATWSLLTLDAEPADDWPEQRDLVVGKTVDLELFESCRSGAPFDSQRFSRCGETFAYLKIDGTQGIPRGGFADKSEIEDALDAVLIRAGLGCHIGGGTGQRYSYVNLALVDVDRAIPLVVAAMRNMKLPTRSWIQFFDSDLRWEWVGIWPDTPSPPFARLNT
jgi:hypothetical protein